jgi:hypothetical protein
MPQNHQQSADAEQDHPGEKLLTVDFAREFVHSFSILRFHLGYSILAPRETEGRRSGLILEENPLQVKSFRHFFRVGHFKGVRRAPLQT